MVTILLNIFGLKIPCLFWLSIWIIYTCSSCLNTLTQRKNYVEQIYSLTSKWENILLVECENVDCIVACFETSKHWACLYRLNSKFFFLAVLIWESFFLWLASVRWCSGKKLFTLQTVTKKNRQLNVTKLGVCQISLKNDKLNGVVYF